MSKAIRGGRLVEAVPLLLVVLLALGVVAVTFVIVARTDALLRSITVQAESIRTLADTVESAVARQSVAVQGNLSDPKQRAEYDAARSVEDTAIAHLDRAVGPAGPAAMSALSQVRLVLRSWHRNQDELLAGTIDLAVHSLKDVPSLMDDDFVLAGFLERGDPRDAWVQLDFVPPSELPAGAVVGTSAPRRRAQFRARFPHLKLEEMRGNVDTRVNKLRAGLFDGAVLAAAGLQRLGRDSEIASLFSLDEMIPAAGQGIVALQTTKTNFRAIAAGNAIDHAPSARAAIAERGVLQRFGSALDCYSAIAVHATIADDGMTIRAFVGEIDGDRAIRVTKRGRHDAAVVTEVFEELVAQGARELIAK